MDANRKNSKNTLEDAINAVRTSEPDPIEMENAAARVWARIGGGIRETNSSVDHIRNCDDYRVLIPDYIAGRLSPARALLFKDHTLECVACRNALNAARGGARPAVIRRERRFNRPGAVLAVAAVLIAGIALGQLGYLNFLLPTVEVKALARTIDGGLYRISALNMNLFAGEAAA